MAMYRYPDGSTGDSPWVRDASGNVLTNPDGSVTEGAFIGYNTPQQATSIMGYGGGGGGDSVQISGGPYLIPSQAPAQPSGGGAAWGGTATGGGQSYNQTPMPKPYGQDGGSVGNVQAMGGGGMQMNPYLPQMFDAVTNQVTTNFNRNVMPRIQSQMAASGGYGGSRQGVVEANAMRDMNEVLANSLSGLAGNAYGQGLNYDLGLRGNDLGYANLDANIAQNNFNNQLTGANFGLGLYDRLQMGNQAGIGAGTNIQNTPMNYWSQFGNQFNSIGQGYGTSTGSANQGGNPFMGALGGWQLGSQWGGGGFNAIPRPNDPTNYNFTGRAVD